MFAFNILVLQYDVSNWARCNNSKDKHWPPTRNRSTSATTTFSALPALDIKEKRLDRAPQLYLYMLKQIPTESRADRAENGTTEPVEVASGGRPTGYDVLPSFRWDYYNQGILVQEFILEGRRITRNAGPNRFVLPRSFLMAL